MEGSNPRSLVEQLTETQVDQFAHRLQLTHQSACFQDPPVSLHKDNHAALETYNARAPWIVHTLSASAVILFRVQLGGVACASTYERKLSAGRKWMNAGPSLCPWSRERVNCVVTLFVSFGQYCVWHSWTSINPLLIYLCRWSSWRCAPNGTLSSLVTMAFSNKMARMAGEVLRGRLLGGGNGQQSCGSHSALKHQSTAIRHVLVSMSTCARPIITIVSIFSSISLHMLLPFSELKDLLQRTITRGEGNSLLVIGPKGSGKSWVYIYNIVISNCHEGRVRALIQTPVYVTTSLQCTHCPKESTFQ